MGFPHVTATYQSVMLKGERVTQIKEGKKCVPEAHAPEQSPTSVKWLRCTTPGSSVRQSHRTADAPWDGRAATGSGALSACSGVLPAQPMPDHCRPTSQRARHSLRLPLPHLLGLSLWPGHVQEKMTVCCPSCLSSCLCTTGRVTSYQFTMHAHPTAP